MAFEYKERPKTIPRAGNQRTVNIKLTDEEDFLLDEMRSAVGLTRSNFIRRCISEYRDKHGDMPLAR